MQQHCRVQRLVVLAATAFLLAGLVACGGGKPSTPAAGTPPGTTQPPPPSEPRSMKEQLAELERTGVLPQLDRSTDVAGPDTDNNGIRDDIDAYIAALPVSEPVRQAARQVARVQQRALLIDLQDRTALMALADASMASTSCMSDVSDVGATPQERFQSRRNGAAVTFRIEAITANTPERAERYLAYMRALHGTTTESPFGNRCEDQ
jgi:hypothetical protein